MWGLTWLALRKLLSCAWWSHEAYQNSARENSMQQHRTAEKSPILRLLTSTWLSLKSSDGSSAPTLVVVVDPLEESTYKSTRVVREGLRPNFLTSVLLLYCYLKYHCCVVNQVRGRVLVFKAWWMIMLTPMSLEVTKSTQLRGCFEASCWLIRWWKFIDFTGPIR